MTEHPTPTNGSGQDRSGPLSSLETEDDLLPDDEDERVQEEEEDTNVEPLKFSFSSSTNTLDSDSLTDARGISSTVKSSETLLTQDNFVPLSQYLHQQMGTVLNCKKTPSEKINFIRRLTSFLSKGPSVYSSSSSTATPKLHDPHPYQFNIHSPIPADAYITLHPITPESEFISKSSSLDDSTANTKSNTSTTAAAAATVTSKKRIQSGIQFPPISWNTNFRKGYSLLVWMRVHEETNPIPSNKTNPTKQLLYRFATSANPNAYGIQAMIETTTTHSTSTVDTEISSTHEIPTTRTTVEEDSGSKEMLKDRVEEPLQTSNNVKSTKTYNLLVEMLPATSSSSSPHPTTLRIPIPNISFPTNEWNLVCIQHIFPILKRPILSLVINGEEIGRGEVGYPVLVGDSGEYMNENIFLAHWDSNVDVAGLGLYQETIGNMNTSSTNNNTGSTTNGGNTFNTNASTSSMISPKKTSSSSLSIKSSFSSNMPNLLQGMIYENGPITGYGGAILPIVPSVVQARDAVLVEDYSTASKGRKSNKNRNDASVNASNQAAGVLSGGSGRGLGIPISVGPFLPPVNDRHLCYSGIFTQKDIIPEDGAALSLQRLMNKLVLGFSAPEDAMVVTGDKSKVLIRLKVGSSLGVMNDVPKIGIVQPQEPETVASSKKLVSVFLTGKKGKGGGEDTTSASDSLDLLAKCLGSATLCHMTHEYLSHESVHHTTKENLLQQDLLPSYDLPTFGTYQAQAVPRFIETYYSVNPLAFILLPFHLALPNPGFAHSIQHNYYRKSFKHLYDLLIFDGGSLAARLIELLAASLSLGGKLREEVLQQGGIHSLATLLRRVLLRAGRLDMFSENSSLKKSDDSFADTLYKKYSALETPESDFADFTTSAISRPTRIPTLVLQASCSLLRACWGGLVTTNSSGDYFRPPIGTYIRMCSDLALSSVFGFALDFDLWGGDYKAAAAVLKEFTDAFCSIEQGERTGEHDVGLGWLVRGQLSVKYLLDIIRTYFNNDIRLDGNKVLSPQEKIKSQCFASIAKSLSRMLYSMLTYSLSSKLLRRDEHDIHALISALCTCPLGSLGAHVILTSLRDILIYCEALRAYDEVSTDSVEIRETLAYVNSLFDQIAGARSAKNTTSKSGDLKKLKSEMVSRLARSLLIGQFHDIVAPIILSRTVFDGRKVLENNMAQNNAFRSNKLENLLGEIDLDWRSHWRILLALFVWVSSVGGPDGQLAAKSAGSLLYHSGKAGSLNDCMFLPNDNLFISYFVSLVFPPKTTSTSALVPGSYFDGSQDDDLASLNDLSHRLHIVMNLLSGLVSSLVAQPSERRGQFDDISLSEKTYCKDQSLLDQRTVTGLSSMVGIISSSVMLLQDLNIISQSQDRGTATSKVSVKTAKEVVPPLLLSASILEKHIVEYRGIIAHLCKLHSQSSISDNTHNDDMSSIRRLELANMHDQLHQLFECQNKLLNTSATLILNAMLTGGGEASTLIWRQVIATLSSYFPAVDNEETDETCAELTPTRSSQHNLLCRLAAFLYKKILTQMDKRAWDSISLCSATARLCDLVEEKNLLSITKTKENVPNACSRLSLDQVRLLSAIISVMASGRQHAGWNQMRISDFVSPKDFKQRPEDDGCALPPLPEDVDDEFLALEHGVYRNLDYGDAVAAVVSNARSTVLSLPASSKLLLPILQPCLRITLGCLDSIHNSDVVMPSSTDLTSFYSLQKLASKELRFTLTSALVGLSFHSARDVCMATLSSLRGAISVDKESSVYRKLILDVVQQMRARYVDENKREQNALIQAYMDGDPDDASARHEARNASAMEDLLLGGGNDYKSDSFNSYKSQSFGLQDDFVLFPNSKSDSMNIGTESGSDNGLGWSSYKGFGAALQSSLELANISDNKNLESAVDSVLSILSPFIEKWDDFQARDAAESELVELFDEHTNVFDPNDSRNTTDAVAASETAADAMTFYIEFASSENSRLLEVQSSYMVSRRYGCISFVEKICWKSYLEVSSDSPVDKMSLFESCMSDGGRDYGGRLITVPICPQFARSIPSQLDNSYSLPPSEPSNLGDIKTLVTSGNLTIVDITKTYKDDVENTLDDENDIKDDYKGLSVDIDENMENYVKEDVHEEEGLKEAVSDEQLEASAKVDASLEMLQSVRNIPISMYSSPPDGSTQSASGGHGSVEIFFDNVLHVRAEGSRKGTVFLTASHLVLEYEDVNGYFEGDILALEENKRRFGENMPVDPAERQYRKIAGQRVKSLRWNLSEVSHVYLRRYRLRDSAIEMFFVPSGGTFTGGTGIFAGLSSLFLDFGPGIEGSSKRNVAANSIMKHSPPQTIKQWPEKSDQILLEQLRHVTLGWMKGRISNFDYLLSLNILSGRSFNDLCQYPVFPWVLSNYNSEEIPDLNDASNFRDLTKPMGALNPTRLKEYLERYRMFIDPVIPSFMYGSHYSTSAGVVLHFLVRLHPFGALHRQLQSGHFDVADRLFHSLPRAWDMCTGSSASEVKELIPEFYCNPSFLRNINNFKLGTSQEGEVLGDVLLPPWAKGSPEKFVEILRAALESDVCTEMLPSWIDLIFGSKQQGPEAVKANNVFFYLTYYGSVDVSRIEDESLRIATELQIAHFGQCPMQLFTRPHVQKLPKRNSHRRLTLSELFGLFTLPGNVLKQDVSQIDKVSDHPRPFSSAPMNYALNLQAPPPGPHAPLINVRLAGNDRCLAVDAQGVFHSFRWVWKSELNQTDNQDAVAETNVETFFSDKGFFVAQRELPHFRSIPRLAYVPPRNRSDEWDDNKVMIVAAISKSLFASHSLVLVISDGDGRGSLCVQLVDPSKGTIQKQSIIPHVHSSKITAIHMDPFGIAAGLGGVGGELAIVGSLDGTASLWRFISSQYLLIRPRLRLGGHKGAKISAVAISSTLNVCVTVSSFQCCLFSINTGSMIRTFYPPSVDKSQYVDIDAGAHLRISFADTNAVCLSNFGYIILVCRNEYIGDDDRVIRSLVSLELYSLEGVHVGSRALEPWRGVPTKISATTDGRGIMVCAGGGVSVHRVSAISPLDIIDEWLIADRSSDAIPRTFDIDFGPSMFRPVVAITACSRGELCFHALQGISEWAEDNKKDSVTDTMNKVLSKPTQRIKDVVGSVKGTGSRVVGLSKDLGREAISNMKEKGMGFLGGIVGRGKNDKK